MDIYHIAFYRFVHLADAQGVASFVRVLAAALLGAVLVAPARY